VRWRGGVLGCEVEEEKWRRWRCKEVGEMEETEEVDEVEEGGGDVQEVAVTEPVNSINCHCEY